MTFLHLLVRNLLYHWRGNLAVFLGITLGSAVLTGALLVGDSLRGSLKSLTLDQIGWVDDALLPGRYFRQQLASEVSADRKAPLLMLQGSATKSDETGRVGKVTLLGIDASFWPEGSDPESSAFWTSDEDGVVLNRTLARALDVEVGATIKLHVPKANNVPAETLMGERRADSVIQKLTVKVRRIVPDQGMARFSLKPTPEPVRNAFVPLRYLQKRMDLAERINAVLVKDARLTLQADLHKKLTLDDWGLRFRSPKDRAEAFFRLLQGNSSEPQLKPFRWLGRLPDRLIDKVQQDIKAKKAAGLTKEHLIAYYEEARDYYVLESRRMMLEPHVVQAVERLAPEPPSDKVRRWRLTPILIYLADTISDGKLDVPYSIIASDDIKDAKNQYVLADDQILLARWQGSPLNVKPGSKLTVTYFSPDEKNNLKKRQETFKVADIVPIEGVLDDPDLVPEVPGVTDKLDITNWENPPFPYDSRRNKQADIEFSKRYRTTPRAYINLKKAQELWKNRFGDLTSIQFRPGLELPETFPKALLDELKPERGGFVFQPVRKQAVEASSGTTPFGVLFLAFSFFLIVSALLLVGLLVRLNIDRRAGEVGLLLATGWDHRRVRWLLLGEGTLLALVGGAVGLAGAMIYARLMLKLLAANWPGGENLNFLSLHVEPASFVYGFVGSLVVSVATLYWATRVLGKLTPRSLLSGQTTQAPGLADNRLGWSVWLIPAGVIGALGLAIAGPFVPASEAQAGCFFGSGALLLTACVAGVWSGLKWSSRASSPQPTLTRLGIRNAGRHAVRSVLTVGLLASASFLIVAVESFHKQTDRHFYDKTGGSGGFAFYAEGNVPVYEDLNEIKVRRNLKVPLDTPEMRKVVVYPCRVQTGDDASCLNLYKPLKPRVMGITDAMIERGGFHFGSLHEPTDEEKPTDEERANPWLLLRRNEKDVIPAIIDANTAQWILKVAVGAIVEVNDAEGRPVKLRIVALLEESIFQSEILISEKNFLKLYPTQTGSSFLLVDADDADPATLKAIEQQLGKSLEVYNLDVATTASRLEGYLAVENMYLSTFQALGGLGLILGAVGLAIVLLRGVWERRAELALLQALGFRAGQLAWLVLVENAFLLVLGLAAGTVSALLAVAPHLVGSGASVLWLRIAWLLTGVLVVGLLSAALAVWSTLRIFASGRLIS
ncbi:MAG: ABC transporter permease [Planctomycetes bacterium]|nr:ABC transporter permease [Planctomycetota bacterium]